MNDFINEVNSILESYASEFNPINEMADTWSFDKAHKVSNALMNRSQRKWKDAKGLPRNERIAKQDSAVKTGDRARRIDPGDRDSIVDRGIYGVKKALGKNTTFQK